MNGLPVFNTLLERNAKRQLAQDRQPEHFGPCGCVGPQNGQPLCPCQMRGVQVKDGRYVRITDLGPAP